MSGKIDNEHDLQPEETAVVVEGQGDGVHLSFYRHPRTQIALVAVLCFLCPGLFNALSGMGGGGQVDERTASNANVALYSTFAFFSFFAGSICNLLGIRLTLFLGSLGYGLYTSGLLAYNIHGKGAEGYAIATGAILGICAALLWSAQGAMMLSYPTESHKGRYISLFWSIFNLGGVVGGAILLAQNKDNQGSSVSNGTYIAFTVMMFMGAFVPFFFVDPKKMVRTDGTRVQVMQQPSWQTELEGLVIALKNDPWICLLFPFFFASNSMYTWHFNDFNGALFTIRSRALNSMLYWLSQIIGAGAFGWFLDNQRFSRRSRALYGWIFIFAFLNILWGLSYSIQTTYTRADTAILANRLDYGKSDSRYVKYTIFYLFCGVQDAALQTFIYYVIGTLSNSPRKLAYLTGFYKAFQSAGNAGWWRADSNLLPYMTILAMTWGLLIGALLFALPMILLRIKDTTIAETVVVKNESEIADAQAGHLGGHHATGSEEKNVHVHQGTDVNEKA